jgi:hypothetical protein
MSATELLDQQELRAETNEPSEQPGPEASSDRAAERGRAATGLEDWTWVVDPADAGAATHRATPTPWSVPFIRAFAWARVLGA